MASQADDVRDVDLTKIHYLSGPIAVETAEYGIFYFAGMQDGADRWRYVTDPETPCWLKFLTLPLSPRFPSSPFIFFMGN